MPKKLFVKGQSGNPKGKIKGTKNRFTNLKEAFIGAFQDAGGQEALTKFAKSKNKKAFYHMVAQMLPKDIHMSGAEGAPLIPPVIQFIGVASDGNGNTTTTSTSPDTKDNNAVSVPGDIKPEGTM